MADTVQQLLRERCDDPAPAVKYGDRVWTWREHLDEATRQAVALIAAAGVAQNAVQHRVVEAERLGRVDELCEGHLPIVYACVRSKSSPRKERSL
jgi:hypothetical protein